MGHLLPFPVNPPTIDLPPHTLFHNQGPVVQLVRYRTFTPRDARSKLAGAFLFVSLFLLPSFPQVAENIHAGRTSIKGPTTQFANRTVKIFRMHRGTKESENEGQI